MRGVSSTFVDRLPSHGLLLLRVIVATALIAGCVQLGHGTSPQILILHVIAASAGVFLLFGAWTPVAGVVVVISELWIALSHPHVPWIGVLLSSLATALALLGPGAWSIDGQRRGWKRIEIRPRQ